MGIHSVKDKSNVFPINIWSCGEYFNNTNGFSLSNSQSNFYSDYNTIGNTSLKITPTSINNSYYIEYWSNNDFNENGKTVLFQVDVYTNQLCRLSLFAYAGAYTPTTVNIPVNLQGTYSIKIPIDSNVTHVRYRVEPLEHDNNSYTYIDNWRLFVE